MKLEWGIVYPTGDIQPANDEDHADSLCGEDQCVVFRYVGGWTKA